MHFDEKFKTIMRYMDHKALIHRWSAAYRAANKCDKAPQVRNHLDGTFTIVGKTQEHPVRSPEELNEMIARLELRIRCNAEITKWHLGHLKRVVAPVLGFTPVGHNDGSSMFINCAQEEGVCNALAHAVKIPGVRVEVKAYERAGSFGQKEEWQKQGCLHDFYLCLYKW